MGRKNLKGTVGIIKDGNRIRLRWRYQSKRYTLNLFQYNKANLLEAKRIALIIEQDIVRLYELAKEAVLGESFLVTGIFCEYGGFG